jgi:hypothetical protein
MEINLDGGEKEIVKAIGVGSGGISGRQLIERMSEIEEAELISALKGLLNFGYIVADKQSFHCMKDVEQAEFSINSGYSRELKEALDPRLRKDENQRSRRVRRE